MTDERLKELRSKRVLEAPFTATNSDFTELLDAIEAERKALKELRWEYDNVCKFATDFENQLAEERQAHSLTKAKLAARKAEIAIWD